MMAEATSAVTVVGHGKQTDLTLPSSVAVAELLPELVGLLDEHPNGSHPPKHWSLHRLGGEALDGERSLEGQGVLDGTMLLLCDTSAVPPPPVVEDISESVASAVDARPGRWTAETSRRLLLGAAAVWGAGTGLAALVASPPGQRATWTVAAGLALMVGAIAAQLAGERPAAAVLALAAVPSWAVTGAALGLSMLPGQPLGAGGAAAGLTGAAVGVGLGAAVAWLIAPAAAGAAAAALLVVAPLAVAATIGGVLELGTSGEAAILALCWLALADQAPGLAVRLAELSSSEKSAASSALMPFPADGGGQLVAERVELAHRMLAWLLAGIGLALTAAMAILAGGQGAGPRLLCVGLTAAVALRTRRYRFTAEILPLALAALAGAAVLSAGLAGALREAGPVAPMLFLGTVAVWTALALGVTRLSESSARRRRYLDRLEFVVNVALVPLVFAALGLFDLVAQIAHRFS